MKILSLALVSALFVHSNSYAQAVAPAEPVIATGNLQSSPKSMLPAGTPVIVMMNEELSSKDSVLGDTFSVTVLHDVVDSGTIVIPKGTIGHGEITFRSKKGGFGKPGILGIALRDLDLDGKKVSLDGRYREEGGGNGTAVAATWIAVGVFSGFIQGKTGVIPKGRELKARTGEDIPVVAGGAPQSTPVPASIVPAAADPKVDKAVPPSTSSR